MAPFGRRVSPDAPRSVCDRRPVKRECRQVTAASGQFEYPRAAMCSATSVTQCAQETVEDSDKARAGPQTVSNAGAHLMSAATYASWAGFSPSAPGPSPLRSPRLAVGPTGGKDVNHRVTASGLLVTCWSRPVVTGISNPLSPVCDLKIRVQWHLRGSECRRHRLPLLPRSIRAVRSASSRRRARAGKVYGSRLKAPGHLAGQIASTVAARRSSEAWSLRSLVARARAARFSSFNWDQS